MPIHDPSTARWLISAGTLAYGLGPFLIDMNRTHLLHPQWTGHARLHLLWAAVSQLAIAGFALRLMWSGYNVDCGCRLAAIIGLCMTSGFWVAIFLRKSFKGTLHDEGGVPPIAGKVDGNMIAVALIDLLLIGGLLMI
jgi:hypothetical protein